MGTTMMQGHLHSGSRPSSTQSYGLRKHEQGPPLLGQAEEVESRYHVFARHDEDFVLQEFELQPLREDG